MTGSKVLLDTSVIIEVFRSNNSFAKRLDTIEEVFVSVEVVGELFFGAFRSKDPQKHVAQVKMFLLGCTIISPDKATAEVYGLVKADLIKKGKPIPENDIWIAAIAKQHNFHLFTTDRHFIEVDGLLFFDKLS